MLREPTLHPRFILLSNTGFKGLEPCTMHTIVMEATSPVDLERLLGCLRHDGTLIIKANNKNGFALASTVFEILSDRMTRTGLAFNLNHVFFEPKNKSTCYHVFYNYFDWIQKNNGLLDRIKAEGVAPLVDLFTSSFGCCANCGSPHMRLLEKTNKNKDKTSPVKLVQYNTSRSQPTCRCRQQQSPNFGKMYPIVPCTILTINNEVEVLNLVGKNKNVLAYGSTAKLKNLIDKSRKVNYTKVNLKALSST